MRERIPMPGMTNVDPPHVRGRLLLQPPFDRIAKAGRALEAIRNDLVDRGEIADADGVQWVINILTGTDERVVNTRVKRSDACFTWGGDEYFTGVSDISQGCMVCDQTIGAGWETYVTAAGSTQDVICRWCGRDEIKAQEVL